MKKSALLLILLFCWSHVSCHWLRCSTGVAITNQAISLLSSTHAGAKVFLLRKYQAPSLIDCLEECCSGKYGLCSVVEFRNQSADANCYYYSCQPITKCKFMDSEGTDSFTFPATSLNVSLRYNPVNSEDSDYDKLKKKVLVEGATVLQRTFKDHARAVAARKGVASYTTSSNEGGLASWKEISATLGRNGVSKSLDSHKDTVTARKGVSEPPISTTSDGASASWKGFSSTHLEYSDSEKSSDTVSLKNLLGITESSFKNDNTTIKPRKGVDSENEFASVKIKPRKGVELMNLSGSTTVPEVPKSKVKARKGAVPLPFSVTATPVMNGTDTLKTVSELSASSASDMNIKYYTQTLPSNSALSTDLVSVLQQVFLDESTSTSASSVFHYSTHSPSVSASKSFTVSSTPVSNMKFNAYTTIPLVNSAVISQSSASAFAESPSMPLHTVLPSKSSGHHKKVAESTPPLSTITESMKLLPVSTSSHIDGQVFNPSHTPMLQTSMYTFNSISDDESSRRDDSEVMIFTISSPNKTKLLQATMDDSESERKYKSSMHLVLSLVFGLLVLFVVLGAVAKRVYDVWMRRHYHRMDFLIDGMYDGFS